MEKSIRIPPELNDTVALAIQNLAEALAPVMNKLAYTNSVVNLRFNELTFDYGTVQAKMSGSLLLSFANIKEVTLKKSRSEQ